MCDFLRKIFSSGLKMDRKRIPAVAQNTNSKGQQILEVPNPKRYVLHPETFDGTTVEATELTNAGTRRYYVNQAGNPGRAARQAYPQLYNLFTEQFRAVNRANRAAGKAAAPSLKIINWHTGKPIQFGGKAYDDLLNEAATETATLRGAGVNTLGQAANSFLASLPQGDLQNIVYNDIVTGRVGQFIPVTGARNRTNYVKVGGSTYNSVVARGGPLANAYATAPTVPKRPAGSGVRTAPSRASNIPVAQKRYMRNFLGARGDILIGGPTFNEGAAGLRGAAVEQEARQGARAQGYSEAQIDAFANAGRAAGPVKRAAKKSSPRHVAQALPTQAAMPLAAAPRRASVSGVQTLPQAPVFGAPRQITPAQLPVVPRAVSPAQLPLARAASPAQLPVFGSPQFQNQLGLSPSLAL